MIGCRVYDIGHVDHIFKFPLTRNHAEPFSSLRALELRIESGPCHSLTVSRPNVVNIAVADRPKLVVDVVQHIDNLLCPAGAIAAPIDHGAYFCRRNTVSKIEAIKHGDWASLR